MTIRTRTARLLRRAALRLDPPPPLCAGHPSTAEPEPERPDLHVVRGTIDPAIRAVAQRDLETRARQITDHTRDQWNILAAASWHRRLGHGASEGDRAL